MTMGLYIVQVYGKIKPGITSSISSRITSYTKGNNEAIMQAYYQAVDGYDEHVKNCESSINHQLFPFLENPHKSHKASEYIDPKQTLLCQDCSIRWALTSLIDSYYQTL